MVGTFLHLTGQIGTSGSPARVNDFETGFFILFVLGLCIRQFVSRSNTAGIVAISTTLFGLMYVPWLLNFIQKINFFPRAWTGKFYLLYFILVTKFSDLRRLCRRLAHRPAQNDPAHQPRQNMGRLRRRDFRFHRGQLVFAHFLGRQNGGHELAARRRPGGDVEFGGGHGRFD